MGFTSEAQRDTQAKFMAKCGFYDIVIMSLFHQKIIHVINLCTLSYNLQGILSLILLNEKIYIFLQNEQIIRLPQEDLPYF